MKIRKKIILINYAILPFVFIWAMFVFNQNIKSWIPFFLILIIFSLLFQTISLLLLNKRKSYLSIITLILAYLFHLSYIFLIAINYDFKDTVSNLPFLRYDYSNARAAFEVSWIFIYGLYLGMFYASCKTPKRLDISLKIRKKITSQLNTESTKWFGKFMVFVTLPFYLHRTLTFLYNTVQKGYGYAANLEYNSYIQLFMKLLLPGLIMWMISKKTSKKESKYVLLLGFVLYGIGMLTGQRSYNLMYIAILVIIYLYAVCRIKIKTKHIIISLPIIYILCTILSVIRVVRVDGMSFDLLIKAFTDTSSNPILSMFNEFAITSNIVTYTVKSTSTPMFGMQIFSAFLIIIPGVTYIFPNINFATYNVTDALNAWNLGGSFVADAYFDFKIFGILLCIVFGYISHRFFTNYLSSLRKKNTILFAYMSPILCEVIFCIRSTTYKLPRMIVFYTIFFIFIYILFTIYQRRRNEMASMIKTIKENKVIYSIYYNLMIYYPRMIAFHLSRVTGQKKTIYDFDKVKKYKNIYAGKCCFIVATAPSLNLNDLDLIKDEVSFGVNSIVLSYPDTTWRPTYYGIQDKNAYEKLKDPIIKSRDEIDDIFCGISESSLSPVIDCDCTYYRLNLMDHDRKGIKHKNGCSKEIEKFVYDGHSITYSMIEIAMYMGFSEICLIGVDCDYSKNNNHFIKYTNDKVPNASRLMYDSYCILKKYAEANGIRIVNASRGWKLDVFDKVTLEEFLREKKS